MPFVTCAVVTTPIVGLVWSTPPIVYAVVEMFVCGGFSTCRSVWLGAVKRVRKRRSEAGRHFWNAPPIGAVRCAAVRPPPKPLPPPKPPPFCCVCGPPSVTPSFCEAGLHLREVLRASAAAGSAGSGTSSPASSASRRSSGRCLPDARRGASGPVVTFATPSSDAICCAALCWNVSCVPGRKKSCTKCVPGLPSFERSVRTERFDWIRSRFPPPPPPGRRSRRRRSRLILLLLRLKRDGQVGADAGERIERLVLRAVEALREARDRDDECHPETEADERDDRARPPADELVAEIPQIEHRSRIEPALPERSIRNLRRRRGAACRPPRAHSVRTSRFAQTATSSCSARSQFSVGSPPSSRWM